EAGDGEVLGGVGQVEQVVRDLGPLGGGGLGRADVHPPVDLHGVHRDQLDVGQAAGDLEGEGGLARRGRPDQGQVPGACRQTAATGMRGRCRGRAVTATSWPTRKWGAAEVIVTSAKVPAGGMVPSATGKWTSLFWRVRPVATAGSRLLGPSTRTSSVRPTRAWCLRRAERSTTTRRRSKRSAATSGATHRSRGSSP